MMAPPRVTLSKMENVLFVNRKCPQRITGNNKTEFNRVSNKPEVTQPDIGKPEEVKFYNYNSIVECNIVKSSINIFSWSGTPLIN